VNVCPPPVYVCPPPVYICPPPVVWCEPATVWVPVNPAPVYREHTMEITERRIVRARSVQF
jgi:hypothetical protein